MKIIPEEQAKRLHCPQGGMGKCKASGCMAWMPQPEEHCWTGMKPECQHNSRQGYEHKVIPEDCRPDADSFSVPEGDNWELDSIAPSPEGWEAYWKRVNDPSPKGYCALLVDTPAILTKLDELADTIHGSSNEIAAALLMEEVTG